MLRSHPSTKREYPRPVQRAERLSRILELVAQHETVDVQDLVQEFGVSPASVRRDLGLLEQQKLLTRTHGGAVTHGLLYELPLRYRQGRTQEKRRIAKVAARLARDCRAVGLTGGTTTTEVGRELAHREGLKVVTNALNIAAELVIHSGIDLVVTGGSARSASYELTGRWAEAMLSGVHLDLAYVGVDGISADGGLATQSEVEAQTNHALINAAARVVVVADSSKIGRPAFAPIATVDEITDLVTDSDADEAALARLTDRGVTIHLA